MRWVVALVLVAACGRGADVIVVGSKNFTEQRILGELLAQTVESVGLRAERKLDLGGTFRLWGRLGFMEHVDLIARFNNVTDQRYKEVYGFPAPPFNTLIGLRVAFQ